MPVKGHRSSPFLPWTVKSCSNKVVVDVPRPGVFRMLSVVLKTLRSPPDSETFRQHRRDVILCAALRPSLMASAVCCFDPAGRREGSGTNVARSQDCKCNSGGSWSFDIVLDISGSAGAYLSARY
jgi:hypothetical protein